MKENETLYSAYITQTVFDLEEYLRAKEDITRKVFVKRAIMNFFSGRQELDERILITKRKDPGYIRRDVLFSVLINKEQLQQLEDLAVKKDCKTAQVFFQCLVDYCVTLIDPEDKNLRY